MIEPLARILKNTPIRRLSERLSSLIQVDVRITINVDTLILQAGQFGRTWSMTASPIPR